MNLHDNRLGLKVRVFDDPAAIQLFAVWMALGLVMLLARWEILRTSLDSAMLLPLALYQDLAVIAAGGALSVAAIAYTRRPWIRSTIIYFTWSICLIFAFAAALNIIFFRQIQQPLTLQLIELSDDMRGIWTSFVAAFTAENVALLVLAPATMLVLARLSIRYCATTVRSALKFSSRPLFLGLLAIYIIGVHRWTTSPGVVVTPMRNPEWAFAKSLIPHGTPFVGVAFPASYTSDFLSVAERAQTTTGNADGAFVQTSLARRPFNVVMVVLESVGSRRLGLYGAPYQDTPELQRLASHAEVFDQIYASQPSTSAAMAALFCSVYPLLRNQHVSNVAPDIRLKSLPEVLDARGYRTAFIHDGQLYYDHEGYFLSAHGFDLVESNRRDFNAPRDPLLVPRLMRWVQQNRSKPFFAVIWTQDTHHPYIPTTSVNYGVSDPSLNRYLNAIHEDDAIVVGKLADALASAGLADNTLFIVTGDHGEAFGEHGNRIHGFTVFDEETRIPLLIVNPRLFPNPVRSAKLGQQIDIAPTILSLLRIPPPGDWQGTSLFNNARMDRAYLFANDGVWGLVDSRLKYILDGNSRNTKIYDLAMDPHEGSDLAALPRYIASAGRVRQRLAAWRSFENKYLERRMHPSREIASSAGK